LHARSDNRHRLVLALQLARGATGLTVAATTIAAAALSVHRDASAAHTVVIAGLRFSHPALNLAAGLLLAMAAIGAAVLVVAIRAAWRHVRAYRHFIRGLDLLGTLPGDPRVTVVENPRPQAFCAGFLWPVVYVSGGAIELLSPSELAAVIEHERHHQRARDPLRTACAQIAAEALFFLPALRPLAHRFGELTEVRADDAAVRGEGGRQALASALLAFDSGPPGVVGISTERVDALLGERPSWRLPLLPIAASMMVLAGLIALVWRASRTASAESSFNLLVVSSQPCVLILALVPVVAVLALLATKRRRRSGRPRRGA
jgi:hypothetical protein